MKLYSHSTIGSLFSYCPLLWWIQLCLKEPQNTVKNKSQKLEHVCVHQDDFHTFQVAHEDAGCSVSGKLAALEAIFTCLSDCSSTWKLSLKSWRRGFPTQIFLHSEFFLITFMRCFYRICNSLAKKDWQPLGPKSHLVLLLRLPKSSYIGSLPLNFL